MLHALALLLVFAQETKPTPPAPETLAIEHVAVLTMADDKVCPTRR